MRQTRLNWCLTAVCMLGLVWPIPALSADTAAAGGPPQYIYVNDSNFFNVVNQVEGFSVSSAGTLTPLAGSPFRTGGKTGTLGVGAYAGRNLVATPDGQFLYAANQGTADITLFKVDLATGALMRRPVRYKVFPNARNQFGATLAMSATGKFLFAASASFFELQTFLITSSGALEYASAPLPSVSGQVLDMVATPDDKYLFVTDESNNVRVFSIGSQGALIEISGSPFPTSGMGAGMTVECSGHHLYVGDAQQFGTSVEVLSIATDGALTPLRGSPFLARQGTNSNTVILSRQGKFLYVGNQYSSEVSSFSVAADGSLTVVPISPFADGNFGDQPSQMALSGDGRFLFSVGTPLGAFPSVNVFQTSADGSLQVVSGSPFFLRLTADPVTAVTIPAPTCAP